MLPQGLWWIGMFWFAFMAVLVPLQAVLKLLSGRRGAFDRLVGGLRVADEITQAGVPTGRDP